jgi:hypothetical protein
MIRRLDISQSLENRLLPFLRHCLGEWRLTHLLTRPVDLGYFHIVSSYLISPAPSILTTLCRIGS